MSERIIRGVRATLSVVGQPDLAVLALLSHEAAVPAMIRVVLVLDEESLADLTVARSLFTAGVVDGAAGDGDVQVQTVGDLVLVGVGDLSVTLNLFDVLDHLLASYAGSPTAGENAIVLALAARRTEVEISAGLA
jgi:hypothetical protein